jgi:hypothetical protein
LKKGDKLANVVSTQNLKKGVFKSLEDIELAKKIFKLTPLIGISLSRPHRKHQEALDCLG